MELSLDSAVTQLLGELSAAQDELLDVLARKGQCLARADLEGLAALGEREQALLARLEAIHRDRAAILERARLEGLPAENLRCLAAALPAAAQPGLVDEIRRASGRSRLLQHHSLTNWVLAQRALIHLSQMLEIIATGGQQRPTYGKGASSAATGALMDQAV